MRFKLLMLAIALLLSSGCTQKIYFRCFEDESQSAYKKDPSSYFIFDEVRISPTLSVSDEQSTKPITDSAFVPRLFVLPTDSSEAGNARFLTSFSVDKVQLLDSDTWDTLSYSTTPKVTIEEWRDYNRKVFVFDKVVLPSSVQRVTYHIIFSYISQEGLKEEREAIFKMKRHDGWTRVIHGRWQH